MCLRRTLGSLAVPSSKGHAGWRAQGGRNFLGSAWFLEPGRPCSPCNSTCWLRLQPEAMQSPAPRLREKRRDWRMGCPSHWFRPLSSSRSAPARGPEASPLLTRWKRVAPRLSASHPFLNNLLRAPRVTFLARVHQGPVLKLGNQIGCGSALAGPRTRTT